VGVGLGHRGDEFALAVEHSDRTVESEMDLDHLAGIGEPSRCRRQLDRLTSQPDRVVLGDLESVLESEDAIGVEPLWPRAPGRNRVGSGNAEAAVEIGQINENLATPWNLNKLSGFYQFEIKPALNKEFTIRLNYSEPAVNKEFKQIFYWDKNFEKYPILFKNVVVLKDDEVFLI